MLNSSLRNIFLIILCLCSQVLHGAAYILKGAGQVCSPGTGQLITDTGQVAYGTNCRGLCDNDRNCVGYSERSRAGSVNYTFCQTYSVMCNVQSPNDQYVGSDVYTYYVYDKWCVTDVDCPVGKVCDGRSPPSCVRICDPNSTRPIASGGECWGCNDGNGSCPAGTTCHQGDGSCVAAPPPQALTCSNGGPACSNPAPVCNNGTCGACTSDAQCPFGQICEKGSCIAPYCTSNAQCSNPTPICETGRCRACHTDSECPANQKCNTGTGSCEAKKLTLCP